MTLIALLACSGAEDSAKPMDTDVAPAPVLVTADPPALNFGAVTYESSAIQTLTLANGGTANVSVTAAGADADDVTAQALVGIPIPPGGTQEVQVTWTASSGADLDGELSLFVQDDYGQTAGLVVPLSGSLAAPELGVSATTLNLGTVSVGCESEALLTLTNNGSLDLEVSGISFVDAPAQYVLYEPEAALTLPWTMAPGESRSVEVHFVPTDDATVAALLKITSNDPVAPEAQVNVSGTGHVDGRGEVTYIVEEKNVTTLFALNAVAVFSREWEDAIPSFFETLRDSRADWRVALLTETSGEVVGDTTYVDDTMDEDDVLDIVEEMLENAGGDNDYLLQTFSVAIPLQRDWLIDDDVNWENSTLNLIALNSDVEQSVGSPATYLAEFQSYKNDPADVLVHAISGPEPRGCNENGLFAEPSGALEEAASLSGGSFMSWCDDWSDSMSTLAEAALSGIQRFELDGTPDPDTIEVKIDDVTLSSGWSYNSTYNRIEFEDATWPDLGSEVRISYLLDVDCGD
jgi:Abnormal spindle-like microcephaly-assoc'd, ASPM-SPD-2-Hydin